MTNIMGIINFVRRDISNTWHLRHTVVFSADLIHEKPVNTRMLDIWRGCAANLPLAQY